MVASISASSSTRSKTLRKSNHEKCSRYLVTPFVLSSERILSDARLTRFSSCCFCIGIGLSVEVPLDVQEQLAHGFGAAEQLSKRRYSAKVVDERRDGEHL